MALDFWIGAGGGANEVSDKAGFLAGYAIVRRRGSKLSAVVENLTFIPYLLPFISCMRELSLFVLLVTSANKVLTTILFQNYALYPHMTVYENMAFSLKLKKAPKDEIDKKVREAAEILDITQYLDRKPKALSGGQRQRVAIGRAIVRDPAVFLMDEPLSNLDAKLRNQMRAEIIKLRQRIDTTFVYVTHDQTEAMTLGDRIVIMKDGFIQQIGTPQEVFDHPANLFVAGFIGTPQMNLFDARLIKQNGKYAVTLDGITVELAEDKQARLAAKDVAEQDVVLGVRPDHIMLCADGVKGKVDVSELMGSSVHLHISANGHDVVVIVPTNGNAAHFPMGSEVNMIFGGNVAHVFSKETEKNLEW